MCTLCVWIFCWYCSVHKLRSICWLPLRLQPYRTVEILLLLLLLLLLLFRCTHWLLLYLTSASLAFFAPAVWINFVMAVDAYVVRSMFEEHYILRWSQVNVMFSYVIWETWHGQRSRNLRKLQSSKRYGILSQERISGQGHWFSLHYHSRSIVNVILTCHRL